LILKRAVRGDLARRANELRAGNAVLAAEAEAEEKGIDELIKEIENAADEPAVVKRFEERLTAVEHCLDELLRRHTKRATKDDLVKAADDLVTKAKVAVEKLRADGKRLQATHIEFEERQITHLAEEMKAVQNEDAHIK
jgi:hypothetical protein